MPVYEYECTACAKIVEMQQRLADAPLSVCPACGKPMRKLISMSSFQLRGGGWYADGYAAASAGKDENAATTAAEPEKAKESSAAPPCQGSGAAACASCPAAVS